MKTLQRFRKWLILLLLIHLVLIPAFYGASRDHGLESGYFKWQDGTIIFTSVVFLYSVIHAVCGQPNCCHRLVRCSFLLCLAFLDLHIYISFIENHVRKTAPDERFDCQEFTACHLKWAVTFWGILNCVLLVSEAILTISYDTPSMRQAKYQGGGGQGDVEMVVGREQS